MHVTDALRATPPADRPPVDGRVVEPADIARLRERPALDEARLIEHALRFANAGSYRSYEAITHATDQQGLPDAAIPELRGIETERKAFRAALESIVKKDTPKWVVDLWERRAGSLLLLPTIRMRGGERLVTFRSLAIEYFDTTPSPQMAYVLLLFLDSARPYGRDLCQCRLAQCGDFFFVDRSQPNRPRTEFCSKPHREDYYAAQSAERVRRSRVERKRRAAEKTKRRAK